MQIQGIGKKKKKPQQQNEMLSLPKAPVTGGPLNLQAGKRDVKIVQVRKVLRMRVNLQFPVSSGSLATPRDSRMF